MEEDTWDSLIWDDLIKEIKSQKTYTEARAIINRAVNELDKRFELIKPEYCSLTSKRIKLVRVDEYWRKKGA